MEAKRITLYFNTFNILPDAPLVGRGSFVKNTITPQAKVGQRSCQQKLGPVFWWE